MTWRDDVADTVDGPVRAGWEILDAARAIAFTGMLELPLLPVTRIYLDRGRIYVAERDDHPDLADRLVAVGAVRPDDLARGVIAVNGVDHLGRLFDRVPALDRQRVVLTLEWLTEETTAWAAAQSVRGAVSHPYQHHPSGVHVWYEPVAEASSPRNAFPPPVAPRPPRRDAPTPTVPTPPDPPAQPAPTVVAVPSEPPTPPAAAPSEPEEASEPLSSSASQQHSDLDEEFTLVWPSGEVGPVETFAPPSPGDEPVGDLSGADRFDPSGRFDAPDGFDVADDPVAHEVALAVRRAIAAVESGTARGRPVKPVVAVLDDDPDPFDRWAGIDSDRRSDDRDDDPWSQRPGPDPLPPSLPGDHDADDERRTTLQRLIDGLRGRPI